MNTLRTVLALALAMIPVAAMPAATPCEQLAKLSFPDARIDTAENVPAGDFAVPVRDPNAPQRRPQVLTKLPAFCRVSATLTPSPDSDIKVEVWLPAADWNGTYQAEGNGGWGGVISYSAMADALRRGFATSSTDTGHSTAGGSFALGHPERVIDFGWRSEHEMTVKAKVLVAAFYGNDPKFSYWNGCSTGGRQGLKEATQFPNDYDGIVSGDAANPRAHLDTWQLIAKLAVNKDGAIIPSEKFSIIHQAALAACDAHDGVKDGLIDNPEACHFDPAVLTCKDADAPNCLTAKQVVTAKAVMSPAYDANGREYWHGWEAGSELNWNSRNIVNGGEPAAVDHFRYVVYRNADWDYHTLDPKTIVAAAEHADPGIIDVFQTDLSAFARHGGKLISYHGWADTMVAPRGTLDYYAAVQQTMGKEATAGFVRVFMIPGMGHCSGGDGAPDHFDTTAAIQQWIEHGKAPEQIIGANVKDGRVTRSRPLCAYPAVARYNGTGSTDDAANFTCRAPF